MRSGWTAGPPSAGPALQDLQEPSHRRVELARRFQIGHVAGLWNSHGVEPATHCCMSRHRTAGDGVLSPTMIAVGAVTRRSPSDESGQSFIASSPAAIVSTGCASISARTRRRHRAARPASWPRGVRDHLVGDGWAHRSGGRAHSPIARRAPIGVSVDVRMSARISPATRSGACRRIPKIT